MKRYRVVVAAVAAACVMATGAASASAAISVANGPNGVPWASTMTLPYAGDSFRFTVGGRTWPCGAQIVSSITTTGAITVSSFTEDSCAGTFTFHTPFSGQIVGSPGNYAAEIPVSFKYKEASGIWTCEHSGTVRVPLTSASTVIGPATSTVLTAPVTASCPTGVNVMWVNGIGYGTNSSARTITGTL